MRRLLRRLGLAATVVFLIGGCTSSHPFIAEAFKAEQMRPMPPADSLRYEVFLVGNLGMPVREGAQTALPALQAHLAAADPDKSALVLLGDHLACCGLPDSTSRGREAAERRLDQLLAFVEDYEGRLFFIPGDRDWNGGKADGLDRRRQLEQYIEAKLDRGNLFLPDDGFPGPITVELTDNLLLVALDTQWWMTRPAHKPYGDTEGYELTEAGDFLLEVDDLIRKKDDASLLIVGHHPLFSNGAYGGHFSVTRHLAPVPGLGSAYVLYRRFFGRSQDLANRRYTAFRRVMETLFGRHERLIYATAHEQSLQHFQQGKYDLFQHYLISGSAIKRESVVRGNEALFAAGKVGFMKLKYYLNGETWVEAWIAKEGDEARRIYQFRLFQARAEDVDLQLPDADSLDLPNFADSTITEALNPAHRANGLKKWFAGSHNRDAWTVPVTLPYFDIGTVAGGLTPTKRGGGLQTTSIRLEDADGREYVLRSLDKDPSLTLPKVLQHSAARDFTEDQLSVLHPFAAMAVAPLAEAVGIYHTNPQLYYLAYDPRFGIYAEELADRFYLFEARPDDDQSAYDNFGNSEEVISSRSLFLALDGDNDHAVDQRFFLRSRLFDMLIGDWDRHEDQWRWASFEPADGKGKYYRPIPRDRDFAFFRMNGVLPTLGKYIALPKMQDFRSSYGYLAGLNANGLRLDRRFTNELTRVDWLAIADSIQSMLSDAVIEQAFRTWPDTVFAIDGPTFIETLKARRDKLVEVAEAYYEMSAQVVDVVGSHKHERFEVTRLDDERVRVVMYKTGRAGAVRKVLYDRIFLTSETREVRLYGRGGNDTFLITGDVENSLRVRAIGGPGEDRFVDESHVRGFKKRTWFYDTINDNEWKTGLETKVIRRSDPSVNLYNPYDFRFNLWRPITYFGFNNDDGVFLGGGIKITKHGFRKDPYAAQHRLRANFAAATQAFNVVYDGDFCEIIGRWNGRLELGWYSPNSIRNFFGLGNETEATVENIEFYQARLTQGVLRGHFYREVRQGAEIRFGPFARYTIVREDEGRFLTEQRAKAQNGIDANTFANHWYMGVEAGVALRSVDNPVHPKLGFRWASQATAHKATLTDVDDFVTVASDLRLYFTPFPTDGIIVAGRIGGAHNFGDFPFYGASTLGGRDNLRGFRSTRFAGRSSVYGNLDLRTRLLRLNTYFAVGELGVLGFFDTGRVWFDGEGSRQFHYGYGGGLWTYLFGTVLLQGSVGFPSTNDETTFTFGLGFDF